MSRSNQASHGLIHIKEFKHLLRQILEELTSQEEDIVKAAEFPKWDQLRHKLTEGELTVLRLVEGSAGREKKFQPAMETDAVPSRPPTLPEDFMGGF